LFYWHIGNKFAVRKGGWKLIHRGKSFEQGTSELYNIAEDPYEKTELSSVNPEKFKELFEELKYQHSLD